MGDVIRGKRRRVEELEEHSTRDRISELSDDVLCTLISSNNLSIRDRVVLTSLSSRWTRLRSFPSRLCFDWSAMFSTPPNSSKRTLDKHDPCAYHRTARPCTWQCKADKIRFVEGVSQFLETYMAKAVQHQVDTFAVDFCLGQEYANHIDQWLNFALNKDVKTLVLKLSCRESPVVIWPNYIEKGHLYTFDCSISNVEHLELKSCTLTLNAVSNFSSLTSLHLTGVGLHEELLHAVSQNCWNLKSLALYHCRLPFQARISSKSLDTLAVHFCQLFGEERIEISAAKLTKFQFSGIINLLSFSGVPNLQSVFLKAMVAKRRHDHDLQLREYRYIFTQLANDLPSAVRVLGLDVTCAPNPSALAGMVTFKVKELNLTFRQRMERFDMREVIHILRAFPVLQKFKLEICCPRDIEEPAGGAGAIVENTHLEHLEEVEIRGFHATHNQIDFAIHLLICGISLKRLVINPEIQITEGDVKMKRVSWDKGEREKLCQALQHFFQEDKWVIIAPSFDSEYIVYDIGMFCFEEDFSLS